MDEPLLRDDQDESTPVREDVLTFDSSQDVRGTRRPVGAIVLLAAALLILIAISGWLVPRNGAVSDPALSLAPAYAPTAPAGESATLYFSVRNDGGADELVGVRTSVAERATLHRTQNEGGFVTMSEVSELSVPADATLVLQPGGSHVMLEGLVGPLVVGGEFEVTLEFERSAPETVTAQVVTLSQVAELVGTASANG